MVSLKSKVCEYDGTNSFGGIFSYLRSVTETSDPYQKGLIDFNASMNKDSVKNVLIDSINEKGVYWSANELNSWMMIDFGLNKVSLSHYTISAGEKDFCKTWSITGSNDNKKWSDIHNGESNENPTTHSLISKTFKTEHRIARRYIIFMNTGQRF